MEKPKLGIQSKINKEIMAPLLILINKEDQKKNLNYSFKVSNLRFLQDQKTSKCRSELSTTAT